jgi:hypothetical protein
MEQPRIVNLSELAKNHSDEIGAMIAGIEHPADSRLWTAQMRAPVRGGKPLGDSPIEEAPDSDRVE